MEGESYIGRTNRWGADTTRRTALNRLGRSLAAVALVGAGGALPRRAVAAQGPTATLAKYIDPLPIPPVIDLSSGMAPAGLALAPSRHQFHSQLPPSTLPTWGYGGATYLGPTFVARRGTPLTLTWTNNLGAHPFAAVIDTTLHGAVELDKTRPRVAVHLHGGHVEPGSDGGPTQTFLPGQSRTFQYANDQEATTLWYHDHALGITRLNVYAGLAGFYLLRDASGTGIDTGLPSGPLPSGSYEIPVVIQDRLLDAAGNPVYPPTMLPPGAGPEVPPLWIPEFFGDVAVVNGKAWPHLRVDRGLYRIRLLNGSNARVYHLTLHQRGTPPAGWYQIGTDGGLLPAPVPLRDLTLAPGERADLLIDFSKCNAGGTITLQNDAVAPFPSGPRNPRRGGAPLPEIMQFQVQAATGFAGPVPTTLRPPIAPLVPTPGTTARNLVLVEVLDPTTGAPVKALLNNLPFTAPPQQWEQPRVNTVEQWNLINTTGDAHPIHLHLVQFQVKERQRFNVAAYLRAFNDDLPDPEAAEEGPWPAPSADSFAQGQPRQPEPQERGWKDTVLAMPGEITRLLVPFGPVGGAPYTVPFTGDYVWHCHILEHEDNEMMLPYRVRP
jgi:FtsP/CotA-like multicopper oxidase with cupredoxin domain